MSTTRRLLLRTLGATIASAVAALTFAVGPAVASTVTYAASSSSFVSVTGDADEDQFTVSVSEEQISISDSGPGGVTSGGAPCSQVSPSEVTCPVDPPDPAPPAAATGPVTFMSVGLAAANDTWSMSGGSFFVSIDAGAGDDTIASGPTLDDISGGSGNDSLLGGDGNDNLDGGGTATTTGGADFIDGQGGSDQVGFGRTLAVNVSLNNQPDDGFPGEGDNIAAETISTGDGDDVLTGDGTANTLLGGDGNDLLTGLGGNDMLFGSSGDDGLDGGPQRDGYECGEDFDVGVIDPRDEVEVDCERTGAEVGDSSATVNAKRRAKVPVSCPVEEANACAGTVVVLAGARQIGAGAFSLGPGATGMVGVRLSKQGAKMLAGSRGTLLTSLQAHTTEPIGTSVQQADLLLLRRPPK